MGYVYLIGTPVFKWYKIGKSLIPDVRIKDLGILLPFRVDIFAIWKAENHTLLEAVLHEKYATYHINGEWFRFENPKVDAIIFKELPEIARVFPGPNSPFTAFSNLERDSPEGTIVQVKVKLQHSPEEHERLKNEAIARRKAKQAAKTSTIAPSD